MSEYEYAIYVIQEWDAYTSEYHPNIGKDMTEIQFRILSYTDIAVENIIMRLREEELKIPEHISGVSKRTPLQVIKDYTLEMHRYSTLRYGKPHYDMFQTFAHIGESIGQLFV